MNSLFGRERERKRETGCYGEIERETDRQMAQMGQMNEQSERKRPADRGREWRDGEKRRNMVNERGEERRGERGGDRERQGEAKCMGRD